MVGRAEELAVGQAVLRRVLDGASERAPQVLFIAGEAGIGKSRLLEELLDRARDAGAMTACGRCLEHGGEVRPVTAVAEILAELEGPEVASLDPEPLAGGVASEDDAASAARPAEALARLFHQVRSTLRTVSARGPLVVAVEDLHWSDRTTRGLLSELVRARGLDRVLLIGTFRSDELHRRHPLLPLLADLEHAARPERLDLVPLGQAEVVELAAAILDNSMSEGQGRELVRRSGGNPFYVEELLAADADTGRLPAGVRHVILARSQSLTPDALACVQAASALAVPIDATVLQATAALNPDRYRPAIDSLCRERFLVEEPAGFRFRHELVKEVFLDELLPGERTELFARAARVLEDHRPERLGEIARLHLNAAQLPEALRASVQAAAAASAVGASAEASEHYRRAIELWDRVDAPADRSGVSLLRLLRRAAEVADLARDFDVAVELASRAADEAAEIGDPLEEGAALLELSGYLVNANAPGMHEAIERALVVLPREPPTVERARLEVRSAINRAFAGERAEADHALEAAADLAAQLDERGVEATARAHIGFWRAQLGDDEAVQNIADQLHLARSIDDGRAGTRIVVTLSYILGHLGRYRELADLYDEGVAFAERHGFGATSGIGFEGNVLEGLEALGRWDQAEEIVDNIRRRFSLATIHRWAEVFVGWTQIEIHRGHHAEVVSSYRKGLEIWETDHLWDRLSLGAGLIELAAAGCIDPIGIETVDSWLEELRPEESPVAARFVAIAARHLVSLARPVDHAEISETVKSWIDRLQRTTEEYFNVPPVLDAWLDQARTEIADASGDPVPDAWARLVSAWEEPGCRFFAAEARYRQADALLRTGGGRSAADRTKATHLLADARRTADELGAEPLRRNIEDLARRARLRLSEDSQADPSAPGEPSLFKLTRRELQVLHLVNEGRSNGEIGSTLFISTKTASVHVSNILRKLGATNRIEAAAIARRHQLVER